MFRQPCAIFRSFLTTQKIANDIVVSGNTDRTTFLGKITGAGNITISSGSILQTNAANVLPRTATGTIFGNGVLRFVNTGDQTVDGLNGSSSAGITFLAGGRPNLRVGAANGSGNLAGQIGHVIAPFTKLGSGTQILSGANICLGRTTISGGILSTQLLAHGGAASGIGASTSDAEQRIAADNHCLGIRTKSLARNRIRSESESIAQARDANTARLRRLRLEKEARDREAALAAPVIKRRKKAS
jgi:autotransporter-associated beta strand protein